jgi:hypothetical protein
MPGIPLLDADQFTFLCVPILVSVAEQIQPWAEVKLLKVQSVFALKLGGLMISFVSTGGQFHGT